MKRDLIVILTNGRREEGTLAAPFKPKDNLIELKEFKTGEHRRYALESVVCIQMLGKAGMVLGTMEDEQQEEIQILSGEKFHVRIMGKMKYPNGFYGFPVDRHSPYRMIFFTFHGVREREEDKPLGKILAAQGAVSPRNLERTLQSQDYLRKRRLGEIIASQSNLDRDAIEKTIRQAKTSGLIPVSSKIGDILVAAGLVTLQQVEEALSSQKEGRKKRLGDLLIERGMVSEVQLLNALATKFHMTFVDLEAHPPTSEAVTALSRDVVYRMNVLPIQISGNRLKVATSKPTDLTIGDNLRFHTSRQIDLVVATSEQIKNAIETFYAKKEDSVQDVIGEMGEEEVLLEEEVVEDTEGESDSQIIRLVNKILIEAAQQGVSDIHFEPGMDNHPIRVRYRIDGVCHVAHQIPNNLKSALISRIKIISKLDISERRKPQSGKIMLRYLGRKIEYRVEITPTVGGNEDAVLRILAASKPLPLDQMGFSGSNLHGFREILAKPYGIILCVGPTGSGKTTTLHSGLGHINKPERKIWTAEDPVEITQPGLRQVQVLPKIGFSFPEALRSFLRADPDVIMIGEMRDSETAKIAIEASLTGHLVFSTLHTNSAPETVVRLVEMGMDPFNFADALLGILAQRLARRLCRECATPYTPSFEEYEDLVHAYEGEWFEAHNQPAYSEHVSLMKKVGCERCGGIGYRGRIAIHELLLGTSAIKNAIKKETSVEELKTMAIRDGMCTLKMDGIQKVFEGHTDLEQILKVCV